MTILILFLVMFFYLLLQLLLTELFFILSTCAIFLNTSFWQSSQF